LIKAKYIVLRLLLAFLPVMLALAPAMAQNTVYAGHATDLGVEQVPGDTYSWELYKDISGINLVGFPGNCPLAEAYFTGGNTGSTVNVMWTTPGTYYFKVTATGGICSDNVKVGKMIVLDSLPTAVIDPPDTVCIGDSAHLTVRLTGTAPWSIILTDGATDWVFGNILSSPFTLTVPEIPLVNTTYWIREVTDAIGTNTTPSPPVTVVIRPRPAVNPIWHN